jgi:CO dehydrogenase maturation factor
MKIMICGKGGSGKSALTVMLAKVLSKQYNVYIIDSDESNTMLPKILGASSPKPLTEYLGGKKAIFKKGEVNIINALKEAGEGIKLAELPPEYVSTSTEGIHLLSIGKVRELGEGCACPFNFLSKVLLKNLVLGDKEMVLVDTDAGLEHLGRGVEEGCDAALAVVDLTAESLNLAKIFSEEITKMKKKFWLVINKVTPEFMDYMMLKVKNMGLKVAGVVRYDEEVFKSSLEGVPIKAKEAYSDISVILKNIQIL